MLNLYMPPRAFFSYSFACRYREDPPRIDGNLREWDDAERLPDLMGVDGHSPFADLYMAWDESGLYFGLEVAKKSSYRIDPRNVDQGDCLELWIDTRDLKDVHRANRYCHHFYFLPGGTGKNGKKPIGRQTGIDQAREQAPPCPEESIQVGLRRLKRSYQMEIALPAAGLNGYQPGDFDRLGFTYLLHDSEHGVQSWSGGQDLPIDSDPSTWGTVELGRT